MFNIDLVVLIPTYNRKDQLKKTLDALQNQTDSDFMIFISDNASNYSVKSLIDEFDECFRERITLISRKRNVGCDANILGLFELCDKGWAWTLADDDYVRDDAVEIIKNSIKKYPEAGILDFFLHSNINVEEGEGVVLKDIDAFSDFYLENPQPNSLWHGDLIFWSNKVYNIEKIDKYIGYAHKYVYTRVPPVIIGSYMLIDKIPFVIVNKRIVDVNTQEIVGGWDPFDVYMAQRTLRDVELPCNQKTKNKLLKVIAFDIRDILYVYFMDERGVNNNRFLSILYTDIYFDILDSKKRIAVAVLAKLSQRLWGYKFARMLVRKYLDVKK